MVPFLKWISLILLVTSCMGEGNYSRKKCYRYSRSASKYSSWDCGIKNNFPHGEVQKGATLEYGHTYRGVGRISTPEECARTCRRGDAPKNCYYKFTVEFYRTLGSACDLCHPTFNTSLSSDCQCILADGVDVAGRMVINRMAPGPSIQVCLGDFVIVDVANRIPGEAFTIHWHGLFQKNWQHYDGAPFITQCPITLGSTFRYRWRAQNAGTHFYHAHTGLHKPDGLDGPLIVRVPRSEDPNRAHYDEDNFDNIIFMKDWMHEAAIDHWPGTTTRNPGQMPANVLINGKGQWFNSTTGTYTDVPLAVYTVKPNRRYRFRMINSFDWVCSVRLTIQDHDLTVIATDGEDLRPRRVTTIVSSAAERYDFVVETNRKIGAYWIQFRLFGDACDVTNLTQVAILRYVGSPMEHPKTDRPVTFNAGLPLGTVLNNLEEICDGKKRNVVCVKDLQSAEPVPKRILARKADISLYFPVTFHFFNPEQLFKPHTYKRFEAPNGNTTIASLISNISNVFPPSPFLTQYGDIPSDTICDAQHMPKSCQTDQPCYCSHLVRNIPLNALVEIILVAETNVGPNHPFHLHGYGFYVMAQGNLSSVNLTRRNRYNALQLHVEKYGELNPRPPVKDTLNVALNGYTIVRFIANNPGYWMYHCHLRPHLVSGMEVTLQVGTHKDLPPTPKGFPRCGSFVPPL